jgi:hypothetical protein
MKPGLLKWVIILGVVISCLGVWACGESREKFAGTYRSEAPYADKGNINLNLKESGEATWKLDKEMRELKFKWTVEGNRLFFYTPEGAVIVVTPTEGGKQLTVDMSGNWNPSCPVNQCIIFDRVSGAG